MHDYWWNEMHRVRIFMNCAPTQIYLCSYPDLLLCKTGFQQGNCGIFYDICVYGTLLS